MGCLARVGGLELSRRLSLQDGKICSSPWLMLSRICMALHARVLGLGADYVHDTPCSWSEPSLPLV